MLALKLMRSFAQIVMRMVGTLRVTGLQNIPDKGPYIIVVNHMSKVDPPLLLIGMPPVRMRFFAGEKWEKHLIFGPLMKKAGAIYINRGEVDRKALREASKALAEGSIFGLAPEGTRSRVGALIEARDGAAYLATRSKVPILPMGVVNTDIIGDNMLHFRRTHLELHIGQEFDLPDIGRRPRSADLAAYTHLIMVRIAALLPERYWGYYSDSPALQALLAGDDPWPICLAMIENRETVKNLDSNP